MMPFIVTTDTGSKYRFQADDLSHAVEQAHDYLMDMYEAAVKVEMELTIEDIDNG